MSPDLIVLSKIAKKIALCTDEKSMKETVSKIAELGKDLIESASFSLWNLIISDLSTTSKSPCEVFQFLDQIFTVLHDINYQHYYHGFFPRKYKPYFMRSLITSRIESFDSFLDCVSKREPSFLLMSWLEEDEHFISQIMGKIETVNKVRILWILKYGLWERIPELLLKRRPEIFDDSEFLNTFLEIFEGFFEHVGILDVFSKDTLNEIMSVLVNSENDSLKMFLDTIKSGLPTRNCISI